jgi:Mlc titration factor MtfA (ptsG expression regulator)
LSFKYKILGYFFKEKSKTEVHLVLLKWNAYYKDLSTINQEIFQIRTLIFIKTTRFLSDPNFYVSPEMKIVISSAFTQVTFGLKIVTLSKFNTIFIAPSAYTYKKINQFFDGDVNIKTSRVNLSWPAVEQGFKISDDALNLCIHEFGHCLIIENSKRNYMGIFNENNLESYKNTAIYFINEVRADEHSFLRNYGGENLMEFFSVSLESFFEKPNEFSQKLPKLYNSLAQLLNQDPRKKEHPKLN